MKNVLFTVLILTMSISYSFSQNSNKKIKHYKVWVTQLDGKIYKGFLYSADEDGIAITVNQYSTEPNYTIAYPKIKMIKWRRKGSVGRSALILGGSWALLFGGAAYDAENSGGWGWIMAAVGGVLGGGSGALIGTFKEKMIINGDIENYKRYLPKLKKAQIKLE